MIRLFRFVLASVAVTSLAMSLPASAGAVEQFQRFMQLRGASATFVQTTISRNSRQQSSGVLNIARPDRFRWEYRQPEPQLIVGDGRQLWIYDRELAQVTVRDQKSTLGDSPASLLAGQGDVSRWYVLSEQGQKDGLDWLTAKPRSREQGYALVRMAFADNDLRALELTDFTGQTTRIDFASWKKNPRQEDALFQFVPPAGVDVLRE